MPMDATEGGPPERPALSLIQYVGNRCDVAVVAVAYSSDSTDCGARFA